MPLLRDLSALRNMHILIMIVTKTTQDKASRILSKIHQIYPMSELQFGNGYSGKNLGILEPERISLHKVASNHSISLLKVKL